MKCIKWNSEKIRLMLKGVCDWRQGSAGGVARCTSSPCHCFRGHAGDTLTDET